MPDRKFTVSNTSWRSEACLPACSSAEGPTPGERSSAHVSPSNAGKHKTVRQQDDCVKNEGKKRARSPV